MSESKSPLASSLPLILIAGILGGALWFCGEANVFPHAKAGAIAVGFGLLGALVGVLSKAQSAVVDQGKAAGDAQTAIAGQIAAAIEKSQAGLVAELQKSQKEIGAFAAQLNTANQASQKTFGDFAATLRQAMGDSQDGLAKTLAGQTTKLGELAPAFHEQAVAAFTSHRNMLQSALDEVQKNSEAWRARFESSINAHASSIDKSSRTLAESLDKIALVGREIEKLLQVQKTIDATLENLAKTDDFKKTISRLADHLQHSEQIIKEATKPRSIRLVESEAD